MSDLTRVLRLSIKRGLAALPSLFRGKGTPGEAVGLASAAGAIAVGLKEPERRHYERAWYWPFEGTRIVNIRSLQLALFFLLAAGAVRVLVAITLGLSDDEAWYWALSEKLQASYVVHPPMSVWLIRATTEIFGASLLGVRLSSVLCAMLGAFWLVRLIARMGWVRGAHTTMILCMTTPLLFLGGILSGPDLPLFAFWAGLMETSFALGMGYEKRWRAWLKLGLLAGLALLSKYTAILAIGAAGLWLLSTRPGRRSLLTPWPYLAVVVAALCFWPVILWNSQHDWSSFRFQFLDRHGSGELNLRRWGVFWISQLALYGPAIVAGWFLLFRDWIFASKLPGLRGERALETRYGLRFLAIWAFVPGAVFFTQPLFSQFKIHWALFAFIPVLVYFAALSAMGRRRGLIQTAIVFGAWITAIGMTCFYLPVISLSHRIAGAQYEPKFDISNDFYGWNRLSDHLASIRPQLEALPPGVSDLPLVTTRYQTAAQAAFALGSTHEVHLIPHQGYELRDWGGPDLVPPAFLYISDNRYNDSPAEAYPTHECTPLPAIEVSRGGRLARAIYLQRCMAKPLQ